MDYLKQNLFQLIPSFSEMVVANLKKNKYASAVAPSCFIPTQGLKLLQRKCGRHAVAIQPASDSMWQQYFTAGDK
jgi:hypothetical protein